MRAVVVTAVAALLVAGCAGEQTTGGHGQSAGHHAEQPVAGATDGGHDMSGMDGMDGMAPVSPPPDDADWNAADATYLTMMVSHHSQAIDMSELAATRASDPRVQAIARSIGSGQGREVIVMATWLVEHGQPEPTVESVAAMSEMGMPGMLTQDQLGDLGTLDGAEFDRRFLEDMIQHHQGAVAMAEDEVATGRDVVVVDMATEVIAGQNAEIARMRDLLELLP